MYATVRRRRSEGIDPLRSEDVTSKVGESPLPALRKLSGFSGCYVFDDGESVSCRPETDNTCSGRLS